MDQKLMEQEQREWLRQQSRFANKTNQPTIKQALRLASGVSAALLLAAPAWSQSGIGLQSAAHLKQLSLDELLDLEVTSVSRRPEKLANAASAIQVISNENIRRSGASSIPEALRLAPNLQVAQVNASQWAISARGFNNVLANKLLVMIDGRTVYTPLYAGVFWDVQDTLMKDIDRIEVISGPGGTLWGANAVNGVINISTQSASQTQGLYLEGGGGNELQAFGGARYGGHITPNLAFKVYGKAFERGDTLLHANGEPAEDAWHSSQGGFRTDWETDNQSLTVQGDAYYTNPNPDGAGADGVGAHGQNVLSRWRYQFSPQSDLQIRLYYDHIARDFHNSFTEQLDTYDLDSQHRFPLGQHQEVIWGLGVRWMEHAVTNIPGFEFRPPEKVLRLYSGFLQYESSLFDDALRITLGSKFEHNEYTGTEPQPNIRVGWNATENNTLWASASDATRTPARIDRDFYLSLPLSPTFLLPLIVGGDAVSETVRAYELGWRSQVDGALSVSLATFFNKYDYLRSVEPGPGLFGLPNIPSSFANGVAGDTYGAELSATYAVSDNWQLRGGYTWMQKDLHVKPGSHDANQASAESNDPENQALLQSMWSLSGKVDLDSVLRYVDVLASPHVPSYIQFDLRLAWRPVESLEVSIAGQNLLDSHHLEFTPSSPPPREIERSVYGKIAWRY